MRHTGTVVSLFEMLNIAAPLISTPIFNFGMMAERLTHSVEMAKTGSHHSIIISHNQFEAVALSIRGMVEVVEKLELPVSKSAIHRVIQALNGFYEYEGRQAIKLNAASQLSWLLTTVSTTLSDELQSVKFYKIEPMMEKLLDDNVLPFDEVVESSFPNAAEDIIEAGKCLALSRSTATAFHLMRAMERAVQRMAEHLDIDGTEREWGKLLSDIDKAIEGMPKGDDRDNWSEAHTHLYHVKQAWRNKTMHPKKTYTEKEAKAVYDAVASFMRHLALLVRS